MSDLIPEELLEILQAARDGKWHGRVELHLRDGEVETVTPVRTIRVQKQSAVGPICPARGCGAKMASQDYSNLWICPRPGCNTKRTRSQLRAQGIAVPTSGPTSG